MSDSVIGQYLATSLFALIFGATVNCSVMNVILRNSPNPLF